MKGEAPQSQTAHTRGTHDALNIECAMREMAFVMSAASPRPPQLCRRPGHRRLHYDNGEKEREGGRGEIESGERKKEGLSERG